MAVVQRRTIIPNRGRAAGRRARPVAARKKKQSNPSRLVGLTLNKGRKKSMATIAKRKPAAKTNKPRKHKGAVKQNRGRKAGHRPRTIPNMKHRPRRRNAGAMGGLKFGEIVINSIFAIAGAVGTKLLTQLVLGSNNTGFVGYGTTALIGGVFAFGVLHLMKSTAAGAGVAVGTVINIILRMINDYTPFGQYVSAIGVGDYQAQAFLTPQVLANPYQSAAIQWPQGLISAMMPPPAPPAVHPMAASGGSGMSGFDPLYGGGSSIYG